MLSRAVSIGHKGSFKTNSISMCLFVIIVYQKNKICSKLYLKSSPGLNLCGSRSFYVGIILGLK